MALKNTFMLIEINFVLLVWLFDFALFLSWLLVSTLSAVWKSGRISIVKEKIYENINLCM